MKPDIIDRFLQKDINVVFNRKTIRKGKLILYTAKDFYISLIIKTPKNINKTFDIPYPFEMNINEIESEIQLDYRLDVLALGNDKKLDILQRAIYNISNDGQHNTSKYLDSVLYIRTPDYI